ncbi:hypothetical protein PoB_007376200 [Plakobranchus ocellatus]|uniref:Uncharacterized protein n=1 Tax=Plakobranchus ocellatus TaxID=259542 RepID=A0AAV4DTB6_9GAST|nr:hypothetical protein PoB_007376200 [Plakobranchus ocellatus]
MPRQCEGNEIRTRLVFDLTTAPQQCSLQPFEGLALTSTPGSSCVSPGQSRPHRLSGPPSGQGTSGGARTRDRRVPADLSGLSAKRLSYSSGFEALHQAKGAGSRARPRETRGPADSMTKQFSEVFQTQRSEVADDVNIGKGR